MISWFILYYEPTLHHIPRDSTKYSILVTFVLIPNYRWNSSSVFSSGSSDHSSHSPHMWKHQLKHKHSHSTERNSHSAERVSYMSQTMLPSRLDSNWKYMFHHLISFRFISKLWILFWQANLVIGLLGQLSYYISR
jgi:hypothetical protein